MVIKKRKTKKGGDVVSSASKLAEKIGIPLKNWHLPKHNYTGEQSPKLV